MRSAAVILTLALSVVSPAFSTPATAQAPAATKQFEVGPKPADAPARWKAIIGEYGAPNHEANVLERGGQLFLLESGSLHQLQPAGRDIYHLQNPGSCDTASFKEQNAHAMSLGLCGTSYPYRNFGDVSHSFHMTPLRPVNELRKEALAAQPPVQGKNLRKPDLVEVVKLDPTIKLDIRYATTNNFMGTPFYTQARAFLQRPAAEAVVRVSRKLRPYGYGLIIHDAYRPWYVTKMFWDATPDDKKDFVADPKKGSNHNRGCAVDLSLYDLKTGKEVPMTGGYDEMSDRSYPNYQGGTSLQRWQRDLLRAAMESEGFTVYQFEWWHFDYKDLNSYPVLNLSFSELLHSQK